MVVDNPTAVRLLSFSVRRGQGGVVLRWRTGGDAGTIEAVQGNGSAISLGEVLVRR